VIPISGALVHEERVGPETGRIFRDFSKIGFTVVTKAGEKVSAIGDRCGGSYSSAEVSINGEVKFKSQTPDDAFMPVMQKLEADTPGCWPYLYLQDPDYVILKERFAKHILEGKAGVPSGLASIDIGLEALKVAEYLAPILAKG
jgi:hypothetical protein